MNIFSNIGITELIVILLLALLVVGPERLPELARQLAKLLRDVRKAYENLTRDLGPELTSIQKTTRELRESVDAVRSIPQDLARSVTKAADLEDTVKELSQTVGSVEEARQALAGAGKIAPLPSATGTSAEEGRPPLIGPAPTGADEQARGGQEDNASEAGSDGTAHE